MSDAVSSILAVYTVSFHCSGARRIQSSAEMSGCWDKYSVYCSTCQEVFKN